MRVPGSARLIVLAVLTAAVVVSPAAGESASRGGSPYAGLGTWVSIYEKSAWRHPEQQVAAMAADGARTLYVETGNYKQSVDLVRPWVLSRFIDDAHAAGMRIVAWYLPSFADLKTDERRSVAAIRFRSATGQRFDGFALDIEAPVVRGLRLRDHRLLLLSSRLRQDVTAPYPLGAITPSPVGMSPSYWPNIPYRSLTHYYKTFLPMAYSTLVGVHGPAATRTYLTATVASIRASSGNPRLPVHLIGGLSGAMGSGETAGFMQAVTACRLVGYSLYPFPGTHRDAWPALRARMRRSAGAPCG